MKWTRRQWLQSLAVMAGSAALPGLSWAKEQAHIVVAGGGVGGATTAKYLKLFNPNLKVTLINKDPFYVRPYGSSEVLTNHITMDDLVVRYDTLRDKYGIEIVIDTVTGLEAEKKRLLLAQRGAISYDRLVVAPGIELMYDKIPGYSEEVATTRIPCGWIPGQQTALLAKQLQSMRPGGVFVIVAPPNPYRCPPGPYERAALMAEWFQKHNPTAKVIITDPKNDFVPGDTMLLAWNRRYGYNPPEEVVKRIEAEGVTVTRHSSGMLEWVRDKDGGSIISVDPVTMTVDTVGGKIQADVINIVPPMRAGRMAQRVGVADSSGFCPIDRKTFRSALIPDVYVVGDATIADMMPKSGFSANTQAKVVARAIVEELAGRPAPEPLFENTCYALAASDYGLFVADVFKVLDNKIVRVNGPRYLPMNASPAQIKVGARYQQAWLRTFTQDCFA